MQAYLNGTQNVSRPRWLNTQLFHSFLKETSFFLGNTVTVLYSVYFFSKTEICVPHVLSVHLCPLRGEEQDFALAAE